jgi:Peroxiredoxin
MYGKKVLGIERTTFIIDEQGIISHIFRKVKVAGPANAVLAALQANNKQN